MFENIFAWIAAHWGALMTGMLTAGLLKYVSNYLDTGAGTFVKEELQKLQSKINENSVMSQIAADDAVIDILEGCIPLALHELNEETQAALIDGKITASEWSLIGSKVWNHAKDQIVGGANDYLKNSSWKDGQVIAELVVKKFFTSQKMAAKGLIVDAPRAPISDDLNTARAVVREVRPDTEKA